MNLPNHRQASQAEALFARRVTARLSEAADGLPHDISERLRVARLQALARRPQLQNRDRTAPSMVSTGGGTAAFTSGRGGNLGPWRFVGSLLPLLALIAGLVVINVVTNEERAKELADIDAAILTDDLPPSAYADPGFVQFLKSAPREANQQ
jgi:hypothetical protein